MGFRKIGVDSNAVSIPVTVEIPTKTTVVQQTRCTICGQVSCNHTVQTKPVSVPNHK